MFFQQKIVFYNGNKSIFCNYISIKFIIYCIQTKIKINPFKNILIYT